MSSLNRKIKPAVPTPCQKRQHGWDSFFILNCSTKRRTLFRYEEEESRKSDGSPLSDEISVQISEGSAPNNKGSAQKREASAPNDEKSAQKSKGPAPNEE